jgi:hypothetical protein
METEICVFSAICVGDSRNESDIDFPPVYRKGRGPLTTILKGLPLAVEGVTIEPLPACYRLS